MRYRIAILGCLVLLISSMASAGFGSFAAAPLATSGSMSPASLWPAVVDALGAQVPVAEAEAACVPSVAAAANILDKNRGEVVAISVALQANATVAGATSSLG